MSQSSIVRTPKPSFTYRLVSSLLVFPVFRLLFRGSTAGNDRVPMQGPLVVVANHGSHLDPPLLGHALGRPVAFMAKAELFSIPLLGRLIRACGAYPVRRVPAIAKRSAPQRPSWRRAGPPAFFWTAPDKATAGSTTHSRERPCWQPAREPPCCRWRFTTATAPWELAAAGRAWCPFS